MTQFALSLDGSFKQEKFFILAGKSGSGSNGKSTLINLVEKAFGDYCGPLNVSYITSGRVASNSCTPEILKTKGKRFVVMSEPNEGDKLNVGKLKEMTGGDTLSCRGLFKDIVDFKPQFTVFLTCNYVPEVTSNDEGTWRRIRLIEFTSRFSENPDINKNNEFLVDRKISDKIEKWAPTFLSMLLNIRINILNENNIPEPKEIIDATNRFSREQDILAQFINDKIIKYDNNNEILTLQYLYTEYKTWYKLNTSNVKPPMSRASFSTQISRNNLFTHKEGNGWKHIRIKDDDEKII